MSVQKFQISDVAQRSREVADQIAMNTIHHIETMYPQVWESASRSTRVSIRNTIRNQAHIIADAMRTGK